MEDICEGKEYFFLKQEEKMLQLWEILNVFEMQFKWIEGKFEYVFYDGLLFVMGFLYYGYILVGIIKDIVMCYQFVMGYYVMCCFGWDCYGLFVEYEIDKKFGIKMKDDVLVLGIDVYNEECCSIVM